MTDTNRKTSPVFNDPDADIVLISNDNVAFHVHRKNLEVNSRVFKDLFDTAVSTSTNKIPVDDSSKALEIALPYFYPASVPTFKWNFSLDDLSWEVLKVFDKYDVARGLDVIRDAAWLLLSRQHLSIKELLHAFVVAKRLQSEGLRKKCIQRLLEQGDLAVTAQARLLHDPAEVTDLVNFLVARAERIDSYRTSASIRLVEDVTFHLDQNRDSLNNYRSEEVKLAQTIHLLWAQSARARTSAALAEFLQRNSETHNAAKVLCVYRNGMKEFPYRTAFTELAAIIDLRLPTSF